MTLASDVAAIVVNETRGVGSAPALLTVKAQYGWGSAVDTALATARRYQRGVDFGCNLASSQHGVLFGTLDRASEQAATLSATLSSVAENAVNLELDNSDAGDAAIAAIATLRTAISTARSALAAVPSFTFTTYRDA